MVKLHVVSANLIKIIKGNYMSLRPVPFFFRLLVVIYD